MCKIKEALFDQSQKSGYQFHMLKSRTLLENEIKEKEPSAKPTEEGLGEQMKGSPVALRRGNWSL